MPPTTRCSMPAARKAVVTRFNTWKSCSTCWSYAVAEITSYCFSIRLRKRNARVRDQRESATLGEKGTDAFHEFSVTRASIGGLDASEGPGYAERRFFRAAVSRRLAPGKCRTELGITSGELGHQTKASVHRQFEAPK